MPRGVLERFQSTHQAARSFVLRRPRTSAAQLGKHLEGLTPPVEVPGERTLRRWIREFSPAPIVDTSDAWTFQGLNDQRLSDALYVLPVMGNRLAAGFDPPMTVELARWIVRLAIAVPQLAAEPLALEGWATHYLAAAQSGEPAAWLDEELARLASKGGKP